MPEGGVLVRMHGGWLSGRSVGFGNVLDRLLRLNSERYDQKVTDGLHHKPGKGTKLLRRGQSKPAAPGQRSLFWERDTTHGWRQL